MPRAKDSRWSSPNVQTCVTFIHAGQWPSGETSDTAHCADISIGGLGEGRSENIFHIYHHGHKPEQERSRTPFESRSLCRFRIGGTKQSGNSNFGPCCRTGINGRRCVYVWHGISRRGRKQREGFLRHCFPVIQKIGLQSFYHSNLITSVILWVVFDSCKDNFRSDFSPPQEKIAHHRCPVLWWAI
jgi:hypothetical protein